MTNRFEFYVACEGNDAIIAMDIGEGISRVRALPRELLLTMSRVCSHARDKYLNTLNRERMQHLAGGECMIVAGGECGPCHLRIGVFGTENGDPEGFIAFYDEDDDSAPALLLIDEQISEFIEQVEELLCGNTTTQSSKPTC